MSAPIKGSQLEKIHSGLCKAMLDALEGEVILDDENRPVMVDGKPLRQKVSAATMKSITDFLKNNGIDSEANEGSDLANLASKVKSFDDDEPLFIPERDIPGTKGSVIN